MDHIKSNEFKYPFASLKTPACLLSHRHTSPAQLSSFICFHQYKHQFSGIKTYLSVAWSSREKPDPLGLFLLKEIITLQHMRTFVGTACFFIGFFHTGIQIVFLSLPFLTLFIWILTALFELAYELYHPPKSTHMICQSTKQLSSKCLISLFQKSLFM